VSSRRTRSRLPLVLLVLSAPFACLNPRPDDQPLFRTGVDSAPGGADTPPAMAPGGTLGQPGDNGAGPPLPDSSEGEGAGPNSDADGGPLPDAGPQDEADAGAPGD
jgi:hypothetical protein